MRQLRITTRIVLPISLSLLALFVALGGSALAVGGSQSKSPCANGAVKGIAYVTGGKTGIANIPDTYTAGAANFAFRYNCSAKLAQVKHATSLNAYDVRFPGNPASVGMVSSQGTTPAMTAVQHQPDGSFRVFLATQQENQTVGRRDLPFLLVVY
jgi:hypothetical protein